MRLLFNKFYSPDDDGPSGGGGSSVPGTNDKDDVIKFFDEDLPDEKIDLNESVKTKSVEKDDEKVDEKDEDDEKEDDDEDDEDEDDELQSLLDDDDKPTDEQLELVTPVRRKEILKKYPEIFKDFPYLEKAYFREQQYTELLPTIDDAKQAVEKSQTLDRFEKELMGGNVETIFKAVKTESPNSFAQIIDDLMPTLNRVDPQAFNHILSNVMKHTIGSMAMEAKRSNSEPLQNAAKILNQFIFGTTEYKPPSRLSHEEVKDTRVDELTRRENEFAKKQFGDAESSLNTRVNNSLRATIEANIDPRSSMTDFIKRTAVRDVSENLEKLIKSDTRFKTILDKLWERAISKGYSQESLGNIRTAYLSKARTLLPSVLKKARIEALRGMGKRVNETVDEDKDKDKSRPRSTGDTNKSSKKVEVPKGMTSYEFLSQD